MHYRWNRETDEITLDPSYHFPADKQEFDRERRVSEYELDGIWLSTVFLGFDHGWRGQTLLFETAAFNHWRTDIILRYEKAAEARKVHDRLVWLMNWCKARQVARRHWVRLMKELVP